MPLAKAGSAAPSTSGVSRRRSRPTPRQRLLDGATKLFTTEGIRVIGIDRILREADVAKASLYSLFGSKDALVIAYLKRMDEQWRQGLAGPQRAGQRSSGGRSTRSGLWI